MDFEEGEEHVYANIAAGPSSPLTKQRKKYNRKMFFAFEAGDTLFTTLFMKALFILSVPLRCELRGLQLAFQTHFLFNGHLLTSIISC